MVLNENKLKSAFCDDVLGAYFPQSQADEDGLRLRPFLSLHGEPEITFKNQISMVFETLYLEFLVGFYESLATPDCRHHQYFITDK